MNAWEIWTFDSGHGDHPAVIISHQERATRKPLVEVLLCSSQRAARPPEGNEVLLDSADGLNWETLCKCDLIYSVQRSLLHTKRGQVVQERRPQIVRTMISSHGWNTL